jgi:hypothetical protein
MKTSDLTVWYTSLNQNWEYSLLVCNIV